MSGTQAAIQAGYSEHSAKHIAHALLHDNKLVRAELDKAAEKLCEATDYNGQRCMAELDQAIAFAIETKQPNAYVKAIELRAKLAGLLRDKLDITVERADVAEALAAARARATLRPICDPTADIEGEFVALPHSAGTGSIDNESTAREFPPSDRWKEKP